MDKWKQRDAEVAKKDLEQRERRLAAEQAEKQKEQVEIERRRLEELKFQQEREDFIVKESARNVAQTPIQSVAKVPTSGQGVDDDDDVQAQKEEARLSKKYWL
eukprot:TRINITY_DN2781_c0_g1_i1.p2 TRINITY_DN2781_c0_g1~~TRINITY_DN2781_c0_g1_i1.p2  ORF type:complete len:103 (+),score=51.78 TRINITY_DN2781_c0_g1_i1:477-785(+)